MRRPLILIKVVLSARVSAACSTTAHSSSVRGIRSSVPAEVEMTATDWENHVSRRLNGAFHESSFSDTTGSSGEPATGTDEAAPRLTKARVARAVATTASIRTTNQPVVRMMDCMVVNFPHPYKARTNARAAAGGLR